MTMKKPRAINKNHPVGLWIERGLSMIAVVNYALVLFNISYIPWRDFYFRYFRELTELYDPIMGIEPHRDTVRYIETVEALNNQVVETGLQSPEVEVILTSLRQQSIEMVDTNPFAIANQSGALETIKNRMRDRAPNPDDSSKQAFSTFWTVEYLADHGFPQEIGWFKSEIKPFMEANYFRSLSETGNFVNDFWRIDFPFVIFFLVEFLIRTRVVSSKFNTVTWLDAMLWRWYDILMFVPLPTARLLRIIPVTIRLDQTGLIKLEKLRAFASRGLVSSGSQELTEAVIIQFINQVQDQLREGNIGKAIAQSQQQRYMNINNLNEIEFISNQLIQVVVDKVIPQLDSDIEALIRYNVESVVKNSPVVERFKKVPGFENLAKELSDRLIGELSQLATEGPNSAYEAIRKAMSDRKGSQLTEQLVRDFGKVLWQEIEGEQMQQFEYLLVDLLEEIKLNYIHRVDEENFEQVLASIQERRKLEGLIVYESD
ncbi:hypothetical protein [Limnospira indica]|uniref:hypothetical protein n=2 Tax=Limnospira TaxID=2596745 RepID=UPI0002804699|nr:hypothetical protein SPLC1_S080630 [Arthrospira platensis C1]